MNKNKKIIIVSILIFIIIFSLLVLAKPLENKNLKIKEIPHWKEFKQSHENKGFIDFNEKAQRAELITNFKEDTKTKINNKKNAEQVSKKFFIDNKDLFGLNPNEIKLYSAKNYEDNWYVQFQQYYKGIPVYGAYIGLTVNSDGIIRRSGSKFYPNINIDIKPKISEEGKSTQSETANVEDVNDE